MKQAVDARRCEVEPIGAEGLEGAAVLPAPLPADLKFPPLSARNDPVGSTSGPEVNVNNNWTHTEPLLSKGNGGTRQPLQCYIIISYDWL